MNAIMDSYDSMNLPPYHLDAPMVFTGHGLQQGYEYMSVTDPNDQYSNFDSDYMSGDEMTFAQSNGLPQHPALLHRFPSDFDDSFAPPTPSHLDQLPSHDVPGSPTLDEDNKYLNFRPTTYNYTLLDESMRRTSLNISAQIFGQFLLAESQWPPTQDNPRPPPELTCYRRNLFQITGHVNLPRGLRYIWNDDSRIPIIGQELAVSALESVENNPVKLISVPFKTPTGTENAKPEDKVEREPAAISLDALGGQDMDAEIATHPLSWKRLQFRIATANNGRRKELQQHFTLKLKVMATLSTGVKIPIAEAESHPIIVRGRSPRNFASRKDVPLSSGSASRKHIPSMPRNSGSQKSIPQITSAPSQLTPPRMDSPQIPFPYAEDGMQAGSDVAQWQQNVQIQDYIATPSFNTPLVPAAHTSYYDQSPDMSHIMSFPKRDMSAPASDYAMSLYMGSDDGGSPVPQAARLISRPPTSNPSPSLNNKPRAATAPQYQSPSPPSEANKRPRLQSYQTSSMSVPSMHPAPTSHPSLSPALPGQMTPSHGMPFTPDGSEADVYEYVPVAEDDVQLPVDALYRPHGIHHYGTLQPNTAYSIGGMGLNSNKRQYSDV